MDGLILILDVGPNVAQRNEDDKCFLDESKKCISRILQRKLYSESKDEVALILMGSPESQNPLYDVGNPDAYKHISVVRPMAKVDFEVIEFVERGIKATVHESDWLDALVVALDFGQRSQKSKKYDILKVVLFTDFSGPYCVDNLDGIVNGFKQAGTTTELMIVGANLSGSDEDDGVDVTQKSSNGHAENGSNSNHDPNLSFLGKPKTKTQIASEAVAAEIMSKVNGRSADFETMSELLSFFAAKIVRSGAWNANLEIGRNFSIPVTGFYKIKEAKVKTWGKALKGNLSERPAVERSHHLKDEDQTEIEKDEVVPAYMYGATKVPFSDEDKQGMMYESGDKAFQVVAVVRSSSIKPYYHTGDGTMYFVARKDDEHAAKALTALVHALNRNDKVLVARKVYRKNANPQMGFAFPLYENETAILGWISLPYSEDIRNFKFPSLEEVDKKPITDEERDLIDGIIEAKILSILPDREGNEPETLDEDGDDSELYVPESTSNPTLQRLYGCLTFRGLRPNDPLPDTVGDHVARLIDPPATEEQEKLVAEVLKLFPLVEQEKKNRWARTGIETFGPDADEPADKKPKVDDAESQNADDAEPADITLGGLGVGTKITDIRSMQPVEDFKAWLAQLGPGASCKKVMERMQEMIKDLLVNSLGSSFYRKALSCLKALRSESIGRDPKEFNDWLDKEFKPWLFVRNREDFWRDCMVGDFETGLITHEDSPKSDITKAQAEDFFRTATEVPDSAGDPQDDEMEDDMDDLL